MKKYLLLITCITALWNAWADTPVACSAFGAAGNSCGGNCFIGSAIPYETEGISVSDRFTNPANSGNKYFLWTSNGYFSVNIQELGGSSWEKSQPSLNSMFRIPFKTGTKNGVDYSLYLPGESATWIETIPGQYFRFANHGAATNRLEPLFKITYNVQLTPQSVSSGIDGASAVHTECAFYYGKWCGDGHIDTDKGEQCDNGGNNGTSGTCSSTCQTNQTLTCNNMDLTSNGLNIKNGTLTAAGGTIRATCAGTNASQYKFVLKEGLQTVSTIDYQNSNITDFSIGVNSSTAGKNYSVQCFVKNSTTTDITATPQCLGGLTQSPANTSPNIRITKNDADNLDDTQQVLSGNTATFTIVATNIGTEALTNVTITDPLADSCNRTNSQTSPLYSGGATSNFDPGESFTYTCTKTGVVAGTFPNNINTVNISGVGVTSNQTVTSTDPTGITIQGTNTTGCDNLRTTINGNLVSYSCEATNANSYSIRLNGNQINTSASGTVPITYGTHVLSCFVNGSNTTAQLCQRTITLDQNQVPPQIQVIKDDNDNRDDQQQINAGGNAQFSITVRNPGQEPLDSVVLSDQLASECNRNPADTVNMIRSIGNGDNYLNPGESFTYICNKPFVDQSTFPNNENRICVNGRGITSGNMVNSCDTTRIYFGFPPNQGTCQSIQITQNGNQINANCAPNGGYKLFVLQGRSVVDAQQNSYGQFAFSLNEGQYKIVCLRDGERDIQPACQQNITVPPQQNSTCRVTSSVRFGGAPLHAELNCSSELYNQCTIQINKDGTPWQTLYNCNSSLDFDQKGSYEAICYNGENQEETCSTNIQVDVMTYIQTGPFTPLLILGALSLGIYITYRRRKTV